ncbi:chaperonin 10-like protein [Lasiosphaeria miniovina]|uniref:Chaperonin 10-like protein n=1 Tax=Lasiosphaeria miniovina TaxID=1954250 RepID=A0AA40E6K6_9PEZI|nr:chaperonin 10-like protein [Lasiosphaeria miniovina]KAK0726937.1 chaperonin 10-like protein [Lasiosphaeria miniovina]
MSAIPTIYRAARRARGVGTAETPLGVELVTETLGQVGPGDVLVRVRAASLNFRDVAMLNGRYPISALERGVPASDCSAEVVAVGAAVTGFAAGDRVAPTLARYSLTGDEYNVFHTVLGGDVDGVLREYAVFAAEQLVHLPRHLSWEEGATMTCAGVTAWNALKAVVADSLGKGKDKAVLLKGTGGVSMFGLLVALASGVRPIITSSSDAKLAAVQKLGAPGAVLGPGGGGAALTGGLGVDVVVNTDGPASVPADIASLRRRGTVAVVGFLSGPDGDWRPSEILGLIAKGGHISGIDGGSKRDFEELNRFFEDKQVRLEPLVDRVFSFDETEKAFAYMSAGKHVGKVVIKF